MKNFSILLISFLFLVSPAFAACSIETGETACSIAKIKEDVNSAFKKPENFENNVNPVKQETQKIEKAEEKEFQQNFRPKNSDFSYDSNCQFGVCRNTGAVKLFGDK